MTVRTLGLLSLVAALAIGGWLFSQQAKTSGPTSELAQQARADASAGVAGINFQAATTELQAWYAANATYQGVTLSPGYNVIVRRADATSYCLQAGSGTTVQHVDGPTGTPQPGPCA
jgi:uncharacterized membrane-anchored protein